MVIETDAASRNLAASLRLIATQRLALDPQPRELAERWKVRTFRASLKRDNARSQRLPTRLAFVPAPRDARSPDGVAGDETSMLRDIGNTVLRSAW